MTENIENEKEWEEPGWKIFTMVLAFNLGGLILAGVFQTGKLPAFVLSYTVVNLVFYWIPPKPPGGFLKWARFYLIIGAAAFLALVIIPGLLVPWLWIPFAYALPVFIVMALLYLMLPPLFSVKNRLPFWKILLFIFACAFFVGLFVYIDSAAR